MFALTENRRPQAGRAFLWAWLTLTLFLLIAGCNPTQPTAAGLPSPTAPPAPAALPQSIQLTPVYSGLRQPVHITHAGDDSGRIFIVEKAGRILLWMPGDVDPSVFLDIQERVGSSGNEQGLLGLAFAPNYRETGFFYVNYTDRAGDTVIARYQTPPATPNQADPASEFVILKLAQPARNHNGGMLAFGPDGYLWIGTGDGGGANDRFGNAQNPESLLGKMLRLDVTTAPDQPYLIPQDNPWPEGTWDGRTIRPEIWAIGLRNPWRYSFDRETGDLWIADVGQNQYEEINFVPAPLAGGLNFGWPITEGNHCFQSPGCDTQELTLPIAEYGHQGRCSVTGGYVYRGQAEPGLTGLYFYGDYCSGEIWALQRRPDTEPQIQLVARSGLSISSFGEDQAGELYVTDLRGGNVYRIEE